LQGNREVRVAAVMLAVISLYSIAILMSGQVDPVDFLRLLAEYVEASFTLWSIVGLLWLLALLYRRRPRNGRGYFRSIGGFDNDAIVAWARISASAFDVVARIFSCVLSSGEVFFSQSFQKLFGLDRKSVV